MTFSEDMQQVALELLTEFGEEVSISRPNIVVFDPSTGIATEGSPTNFNGVGYPSPYNKKWIDGVTVLASDVELILYSTTEPKVGDVMTLGSLEYTAIAIDTINAQGNNVYYDVQLRQ